MDVKVYKKELVKQPSGAEYVFVPDVIDLMPVIIEQEKKQEIIDKTWSLDDLKKIADVSIKDGKLIINSGKVSFRDGVLYVDIQESQILTVETLDDDSKDLDEQRCTLATIFQKGLDPLDVEDGIRWSEAILGEINSLQLIEDIQSSLSKESLTAKVEFNTVTDAKGNSFLSYKINGV